MKSTQVYAIIREIIGPWAKSAGFKRGTGGMLSYVRSADDLFHTFWFQCSQDGWDDHTGSKFTLEFQESTMPEVGSAGTRVRFFRLLTLDDREQVRSTQNSVISRLSKPPRGHWAHGLEGDTKKWYFSKFELVREPYRETDDVWLRYGQDSDVRQWAELLLQQLPRLLDGFNSRCRTARNSA
jgi:hypothetical protein